jgi:RNA polymerase sigma-70 factor (ECF subfamily)
MTDLTLHVDRAGTFEEAERSFHMTEDAFRAFYEQTARGLWLYVVRMTGDARLADDLLQETYYRFLRSGASFEGDDHRRHYLFRIATNLVHDHRRRARVGTFPTLPEEVPEGSPRDTADRVTAHIDLTRALAQLKPRERSMLWLAYAQGFSHDEIAATLGLKTASLKALLHRARRRLAALLANPRQPGGRS